MNKAVASTGLVLVFIAAVLFYIVFSGGEFIGLTVTGTDATANFIAFLYVIAALPIGSGLAYFGLSFRTPMYAAGGSPPAVYKSSSIGTVGLVVGVIAIILAAGAIGVALTVKPSSSSGAVTTLSSQVSSLSSEVSALKTNASNLATVNVAPSPIAVKVDWCNTDNTGQDRFCPSTIVVDQGDIVQILFIHNDTDAHTFTLDTSPYQFQINDSSMGMHNFLTDQFNTGNCSNTGSIAQEQSGLSSTFCVSGSSVLSTSILQPNGASKFLIAQNPDPASPLTNGPIELTVDNQVHFNNITAANNSNATTSDEVWGIAAFQATTPGIYEYFCHYHVSNGMFGYLVVLPNSYCESNAATCNLAGS
jgi:plastocyanin